MTPAEQIAPLLKEAIEARMKARDLVGQVEEILAGPEADEVLRVRTEDAISEFIDAWLDAETFDGFGAEDVKELLEDLSRYEGIPDHYDR